MDSNQKTIAIVGGGIAGLAAAYQAQSAMPSANVVLFESSQRLGGVLHTERIDGYLVERSADMFTTEPADALELCRRLGKEDQLIETIPTQNRAYVATENGIHPVPRGLSLMLPSDLQAIQDSPLLDAAATLRFLEERNIEKSDWREDESLESFAVRRFGRVVFERLIQPLVGGIYTADPKKLSMRATMARFVEMELEHGSLIKAAEFSKMQAAEKEASGARYSLFRAPKNGMGDLVKWLEEALLKQGSGQDRTRFEFQLGSQVDSILNSNSGWQLDIRTEDRSESLTFDAVLLATPARTSAGLLNSLDASLALQLQSIEAASSAIVVMGIDQAQMLSPAEFAGYGIIVPHVLNRRVIATSFASHKFAGRAPAGKVLVRSFIGGALQKELVDCEDNALIKFSTEELAKTVNFTGSPDFARVYRWRNCMPQYHLGHLERSRTIDSMVGQHPGLELAGNSYHGVGIPACIKSGAQAMERLVNSLTY
ncbi:MAG: oxygen-dependent protoporphyrinogen oxidase [Mariniblastus sp.]|jgi:oxygen-dependent protoporphyrinogen oxidase